MEPCKICGGTHEHAHHVTVVNGVERFATPYPAGLEGDVALLRCPFCNDQAGYRQQASLGDPFVFRVECSNTSCMVATPYHYKTRDTAKAAWNRRAPGAYGIKGDPFAGS